MKKLLNILPLLLILVSLNCLSQNKFGHINSQALIDIMPESKNATTELESYGKELQDEEARLTAEFERKYADLQKLASSMSDVQQENKYKELQELETRIVDFQQNMQTLFQQKYTELVTPIEKKALEAIQSVGKENGFTYVFDQATILYTSPKSEDVLPLVKKKLGL